MTEQTPDYSAAYRDAEPSVHPVLPLRDIVVFPAHDRAAVRGP
jgi:hypothetical protein